MAVVRFDPFRELDRLADQAWGRGRPPVLPLDAYRRADEVVLQFDLPGVDPASIDVTVERNVLTVTAERATDRREGDEIVVAERPVGQFSRQLQLGDGLDTDKVHASYDAGVLTVTFPIGADVRPRRITVTQGGRSGIDVSAHETPLSATSEATGSAAVA